MISLRYRIPVIAAIAVIAIGFHERVWSLDSSSLEQIASAYASKVCLLKVDLHEPDTSGEGMLLPTLEKKGWHNHNPSGPIVLSAGTRVEVTGVFNYSDRGLFLELARESSAQDLQSIASRPRCRIRIMVEALPADPAGQVQEAAALIGKVLEAAANP